MSTRWDPAAKGTNITLSNTNHTASDTLFGDNGKVLGGPTSHSSGKWYLEYSSITSSNSFIIGFGKSTISLNDNTLTGMIGIDQTGSYRTDGGSGASGLGTPVGHTMAIAIDFDLGKIWFRYDNTGLWNGSGAADPATNVGGLSLFSVTGTFLPAAFLQNLAANGVTLNAGDTAFSGAIPSGFTAWDSTPPFIGPTRLMVIH